MSKGSRTSGLAKIAGLLLMQGKFSFEVLPGTENVDVHFSDWLMKKFRKANEVC